METVQYFRERNSGFKGWSSAFVFPIVRGDSSLRAKQRGESNLFPKKKRNQPGRGNGSLMRDLAALEGGGEKRRLVTEKKITAEERETSPLLRRRGTFGATLSEAQFRKGRARREERTCCFPPNDPTGNSDQGKRRGLCHWQGEGRSISKSNLDGGEKENKLAGPSSKVYLHGRYHPKTARRTRRLIRQKTSRAFRPRRSGL